MLAWEKSQRKPAAKPAKLAPPQESDSSDDENDDEDSEVPEEEESEDEPTELDEYAVQAIVSPILVIIASSNVLEVALIE